VLRDPFEKDRYDDAVLRADFREAAL